MKLTNQTLGGSSWSGRCTALVTGREGIAGVEGRIGNWRRCECGLRS